MSPDGVSAVRRVRACRVSVPTTSSCVTFTPDNAPLSNALQTNADLMADLIAGRSENDKSAFDCDLDTVVNLWSVIPVPKKLHVVTHFGGSTDDKDAVKDAALDDIEEKDFLDDAEEKDFLDELNLSARVLDYGFYVPNLYTAGLQVQTEVTFHTGHALKMLFEGLMEFTNTFTLIMPEAGYRVNTKVRYNSSTC
eukprot:1194960-Prorocentrum_minimum.AAC.2